MTDPPDGSQHLGGAWKRAGLAAAVVIAFAGVSFLLVSTPPDGSRTTPTAVEPDRATSLLADPDSFAFPPVAPALADLFASAKRHHRDALRRYSDGNRDGGHESAGLALDLYERSEAMVPELETLHHELVVDLTSRHRLDEAVRAARRWVKRFGDDVSQRENLARLLFRSRRFPEATAEIRRLLESGDDENRYLSMLADVAIETGDYEIARKAIQGLVGADGETDGDADLMTAARTLVHFEDLERALPLLERLRRSRPTHAWTRLALGRALGSVGREADARAMLATLLEHADVGARALLASARSFARSGERENAIRAFDRLLSRDPWSRQAYHLLGRELRRSGRESEALIRDRALGALATSERERVRAFQHESEGRPVDGAWHRALAFDLEGRFRDAESALTAAHVRAQPAARLRLARLLVSWLRGSEARAIVTDLERASSSPLELSHLSASIHELMGSPATAAGVLHDRGDVGSLAPRVIDDLGRWLTRGRRAADAVRILRDALERMPESTPRRSAIVVRLAAALIETGDFAAARDRLDALRARGALSPVGSLHLARARFETGASVEGIEAELRKLPPVALRSIECLRLRQLILSRTDAEPEMIRQATSDLENAETALARRRALRARIAGARPPASSPLLVELSRLLATSDRGGAIRTARLAVAADPENVDAWKVLARQLDEPSEHYYCVHAWRNASRLRPDDTEARTRLAEVEHRSPGRRLPVPDGREGER